MLCAMWLLGVLYVLKFSGLMLLAGGTGAGLLASSKDDRTRAVHGIASPGLLVTWGAGYALASLLGIAMTELWILGGLALSFVSQLALVRFATHGPSKPLILAVLLPLFMTVALMVFRPSWTGTLP